MATTRAVVSLPRQAGLDSVVNVMHFKEIGGGSTATPADLTLKIAQFYNLALTSPTEVPIAGYLSGELSRATDSVHIQYYLVPDVRGPVGAPYAEGFFTLGALAGSAKSLPAEVAACLTFDSRLDTDASVPETVPGGPTGPEGDAHPRARRRGRIYLGPLNDTASSATGGGTAAVRVSAAFRSSAVRAFSENLADGLLPFNLVPAVFSPTDWIARRIVRVWMDDAFDTQRRRGVDRSFANEVVL